MLAIDTNMVVQYLTGIIRSNRRKTQMRWAAEMLTDYNQELLRMAAIYAKLGPTAGNAQAERQS
jgi:cytochrome c553